MMINANLVGKYNSSGRPRHHWSKKTIHYIYKLHIQLFILVQKSYLSHCRLLDGSHIFLFLIPFHCQKLGTWVGRILFDFGSMVPESKIFFPPLGRPLSVMADHG